jgi:chromosome segregation ATPase
MPDGDGLARDLERERAARAAAEEQIAQLERRLLDAEQRAARIPELEVELRDVTTRYHLALEAARAERDEARVLLERARRVHEQMVESASWRVTAPLRALKRRG